MLLSSGAAHAEDEYRWAPPEVEDVRPHNGASFSLGTMFVSPRLGDTIFTGDGTPVAGGPSGFRHTARDMGIAHPMLMGGEVRAAYVRRYIEVGIQGYMGGDLSGGDAGASSVRPLVDAGNVSLIGGGGHILGVIPVGPFSFTFGPDAGARAFSVPLTGFRTYECQTKAGKKQCQEQATAQQFYVEPRIGVLINTGSIGKRLESDGVFIHAWVGGDMIPASSLAFGLSIGGAFNHAAMAP